MKSRDIFLPSLGSILIAGMVAFLSCAHQNRNAEDMDMASEDSSMDSTANSGQSDSDEASLAENSKSTEDVGSSELESLSDNTTPQTGNSADPFEKDLESVDSETAKADLAQNTQSTGGTNEPSLEDQLEGMDSSPATTPTQSEASPEIGAAGGTMALNSDLDSNKNSGDPIQPKTEELNAKEAIAPELDSVSKETLNIDKKPFKHSYRVASRIPRIPAKAIKRKGTTLNRFYFVRKGDTPKKVAGILYGSPNQASNLVKWNGKSWTPGKIIYYASAQKPKDPNMDSFYKENGVTAEEYSVGHGEWLSKIAMKKLGSPSSWTEIAVINGIKKPKALEVGQKIAIYPLDLSRTEEPALAQNEPVQKTPVVEANPVQPPPVVEPPTQKVPEEPPPTPIAPAKEPVKAAPAGFDAQKFIEQNAFAGLMGLAGFFLILLLIVKKRNKSRANTQDDFLEGEEGFQPPTKLKRK